MSEKCQFHSGLLIQDVFFKLPGTSLQNLLGIHYAFDPWGWGYLFHSTYRFIVFSNESLTNQIEQKMSLYSLAILTILKILATKSSYISKELNFKKLDGVSLAHKDKKEHKSMTYTHCNQTRTWFSWPLCRAWLSLFAWLTCKLGSTGTMTVHTRFIYIPWNNWVLTT